MLARACTMLRASAPSTLPSVRLRLTLLIYNSGVHFPMTYGLHNYGYTHYPYTTAYSHIFKREAEAEAEPQFYNSFYGNHAFTYRAYPYTYSSYNYPSYYYQGQIATGHHG